jgi:hypothetical protein
MAKIFVRAEVPEPLVQRWLQHMRDFDSAHHGCHFEVAMDAPPDESLIEMVEKLRVNPELTFTQIFERSRKR